jgi:hypothetical protein
MKTKIYLATTILVSLFCCKKKSDNEKSITFFKEDTVNVIVDSKKVMKKSSFVPDIRINDLELVNPNSILKSIGNLKNFKNEELFFEFANSNKKFKLTLVAFPGSSQNDIYQIKVEHILSYNNLKVLPYENFITESNIKLGITKEELVKIKGNNYLTENNVIKYSLSHDQNKDFFTNFNMPFYYANYSFEKGRLIKIDFGFLYP